MQELPNDPKALACGKARTARLEQLGLPNVAPLSALVHHIRQKLGDAAKVPFFDPLDGGVNAACLFLLEAPGPKACDTGFVSRDNPDETAKNFFLLNQRVGIPRDHTAMWNIVPWYVGTGKRIRPVNLKDVKQAEPYLEMLVSCLPKLRRIVLVGNKASAAETAIKGLVPDAVQFYRMPHPSPMHLNRHPDNWNAALQALQLVAEAMESDHKMGISAVGGCAPKQS